MDVHQTVMQMIEEFAVNIAEVVEVSEELLVVEVSEESVVEVGGELVVEVGEELVVAASVAISPDYAWIKTQKVTTEEIDELAVAMISAVETALAGT